MRYCEFTVRFDVSNASAVSDGIDWRRTDGMITLHDDPDTILRQDQRRVLGTPPALALISSVGGKNGGGWRAAVRLVEQVGNEIGFVGVVEGREGVFKLESMVDVGL